jgi:hypothetical protein
MTLLLSSHNFGSAVVLVLDFYAVTEGVSSGDVTPAMPSRTLPSETIAVARDHSGFKAGL